MKIAIYETVHLDWVIPYAELLGEEEVSICFITSNTFRNDLEYILAQKNPRFTWYFLNPDLGLFRFLRTIYNAFKSNSYDLVILNSIDSRHLIMFLVLIMTTKSRILLNLHDINNFFKIRPTLNIRTNVRSIGKRLLMLLADGYIVNAETMKAYMIKNALTTKPVYWLQPAYYKPPILPANSASITTIVIPGTIDARRRDYELVLQVIQAILDRNVKVNWVLAGKPVENYGSMVIDKARELNSRGAKISFYEEEIPETEFQQIIANCSLVFSPLVSSTVIHDNIPEVYGQSKGSGNVYDVIRHAKPFIVPSTVSVPREISTSCIVYESKENLLEQLLVVLTDHSVLAGYQQKAERNSLNFTKDRIKDMFKEAFVEVTST